MKKVILLVAVVLAIFGYFQHKMFVQEIENNLKLARQLFNTSKYSEAEKILSLTIPMCKKKTSYYANALVMYESLKKPRTIDDKIITQDSINLLLIDPQNETVLLQKRGFFKRIFPGKLTVSVNYKGSISVEQIEKETGIFIDTSRIKDLGRTRSSKIISYTFISFSKSEKTALIKLYNKYKSHKTLKFNWNEHQRSLSIFCTDFEHNNELRTIVDLVQKETLVPPVYFIYDNKNIKTMIYLLNQKEVEQIHKIISAKSPLESNKDSMEFQKLRDIKNEYGKNKEKYAVDITDPTFEDPNFWSDIFPYVIKTDSDMAKNTHVSGGKGANICILKHGLNVNIPDASIITTNAYKDVVLKKKNIKDDIELLDKLNDNKQIAKVSKRIRKNILKLRLPDSLSSIIKLEFNRLGKDIVVRSSATTEDLKNFSAAGLAESYINVTNLENAKECVKKVWASLFSDGFINARNKFGFKHANAFMGVVLQKYIQAKAAGVIFSIHPTNRPVYMIHAQFGIGEKVVQGEGLADEWLVGPLADTILETNIPTKTACLSDQKVLEIAGLAKNIHEYYKHHNLAENVDIEFVIDNVGIIHVVQVRSKHQNSSSSGAKSIFNIPFVDLSKLPRDASFEQLDEKSSVATYGVVSAKLQVLKQEKTNEHLASKVKPGVILVTHHTNNEFNGVFSKLAGIVTTDGNTTSHAAQNSTMLKIPCIVGSCDAIEKLSKFDGKVATLDTYSKRVYLGTMPMSTKILDLNFWSNNPTVSDTHEIFESWEKLNSVRPDVFREHAVYGRVRLRSNYYRKFQIDCYYQAWDKLTSYLNKKFEKRSKWKLKTQQRIYIYDTDIKNSLRKQDEPESKIVRKFLCHCFVERDPHSIFSFLKELKDLSIDDLEELFNERAAGFKKFGNFINSIAEINKDNVERVIEETLKIFQWMHFAFWLDVAVNHIFVNNQLKYVNKEYHEVLKDESTRNKHILKLSRIKDIEMNVLVAKAFSDKNFWSRADVYRTIDSWSARFKNISEHMDELSDTDLYIRDLQDRIQHTMFASIEFISKLCVEYIISNNINCLNFENIKKNNEVLHILIEGIIRITAAKAKANWKNLNPDERARLLLSLSKNDLKQARKECHSMIRDLVENELSKRSIARDILDMFPKLKRCCSLSQQEFLLREDGHHLMVGFQRKLAKLLLDVGIRYKKILGRPDRIFDISPEEIVAMLHEPNPDFIRLTIKRELILKEAELALYREYKANPDTALRKYKRSIKKIQTILTQQIKMAKLKSTKNAYVTEYRKLDERCLKICKTKLF